MIDSNDSINTNERQLIKNQRMSSSEAIVGVLSDLVDERDIISIVESQKNMLMRFEKSNEMLVNCNALAIIRFENANRDLKRYTQQLVDMQKDLDSVFHRIKFLKLKLSQYYPNAFKACGNLFNALDEEEEESTDNSKNINIKADH